MATNLSDLKPAKGSKFTRKRVGRGPGSGSGKTAARGYKGAQSRSGYKQKRGFEGGQMPLHRRRPQARLQQHLPGGVRGGQPRQPGARFEAGAVVDPDTLRASGLVYDRTALIKVLAQGEVTKALTVSAHKFSGKAAEKIAAAGGTARCSRPRRPDGQPGPDEA